MIYFLPLFHRWTNPVRRSSQTTTKRSRTQKTTTTKALAAVRADSISIVCLHMMMGREVDNGQSTKEKQTFSITPYLWRQ
jgi:hypothetical protein